MQTGHELLKTIDFVAKEKGIDKKEIYFALESAIQKAAKACYGYNSNVHVTLNVVTGQFVFKQVQKVVLSISNLDDDFSQILLEKAKLSNPNVEIGDTISEILPSISFSRIGAQIAKQVIFQKVKEAEKKNQYEDFKHRIGEIISGIVKRIDFGNIIIDLGRAEGLLHRSEAIPRESFRPGDRVRTYVMDVCHKLHGFQIFLSRSHPKFMIELFKQEVPEIYDGIIVIKSVSRDPGSRAKMAVYTTDSSLDPVGSCVGVRGSRVQAVVNELRGEKIDIIPWSEVMPTFIVNALIPAEISKVILDEDNGRVEVVVMEDQLSLAIGRRGQNVRLASKLTNRDIDIISENDALLKHNNEIEERSTLFSKTLDVDSVIAQLLASEGFESVEDVSLVSIEELSSIEGFDNLIATELQERANLYLREERKKYLDICKDLKVSESLISLDNITLQIASLLGKSDIRNLEDLASLSRDELIDILKKDISIDKALADSIIINARKPWFE